MQHSGQLCTCKYLHLTSSFKIGLKGVTVAKQSDDCLSLSASKRC